MNRAALDKHLRSVLKEAQQAYRRGIAAQVLGETGAEHWRTFHEATAALLMASWLFGAREAIDKAKIPDEAVAGMLEDNTALTFDRLETGVVLEGFGRDFLAPIANWFRSRVPISRTDWDVLIEAAQRSGGEVADHERDNALPDMRARNPVLDSLLRGITVNPQGGQISTAKRITDGTFFVTAMNPKQTRQTQELIARVIEEKPGKSVVGKWIRKMNLGDFVTTTQMVTGTHLTTARLETVLRTNTNRAATEGLAETLREPKVQAFVPLVEYSATGDNRTRPTHQGLDGYIGTMEMFDRQGIAPPCGFNCRCALIPVPAARALERGWTDVDGNVNYAALKRHNGKRQQLIDTRQIPDPGFVNA
jgi:SPP1 gp7 family putative phage head morphogenesis protein